VGINHLQDFNLFNKALVSSVACYHYIHSPNNVEDPLVQYSAEGGIISRRTKEESNLIRDILTCWTYPHIQMYWDQLSEYIPTVVAAKVTNEQIGTYLNSSRTYYIFHHPILEEFAHVVLALH
jgi:hypothetical protein